MKKLVLMAAAAALCVPLSATPALAQDRAIERVPLDWYRVTYFKFHPTKRDRAEEIQETYYMPAAKAAGLSGSMMFHLNTGGWDMMAINPMRHGPDAMSWASNPDQQRRRAEFVKIAGGEKQADAIDAEYESTIMQTERHIAHIDKD